jgi:asparagine synthase (glutamine-hydrolysing)
VTAICGRVDWQESVHCDCSAMLVKLARFGSANPKLARLRFAEFGVSLVQTLVEDEFDRQPLSHADRWLLAADVRLDNRNELKRTLALNDRQVSDSEILLHALIAWGEGTLDRIVGDFAFGLLDSQAGTLLLARDPTGQRPLYYAAGKGFAAFASMPNGLLGTSGVGTELNREALARALSNMPTVIGSSYLKDVQKVGPGQLVLLSNGGSQTRDYWNPSCRPRHVNGTDYVEAYRSLLDKIVEPKLRRKAGAVAVQLSSGLDSSAVCAAAARLTGANNLIGYTSAPPGRVETLSPRGRFPDESELAKEISSYLGVRHRIVRETGSAIDHLRAQAGLYQEPYRNNINAGWLTGLARAARADDCRVMLSGEGGNLSLNGGSLAILGDLIRLGDWRNWLREARLAMAVGGAQWTGVLMNSFGSRLPAWVVESLESRFLGATPRSAATFVRREFVDEFVRPAPRLLHEVRTNDSYLDRLAIIRAHDFGNLNKGMLAETGVDMRHPYFDRRAIEFSLTTPPLELLRDGRSRSLARRGLVGSLPLNILTMNARGYQAADWQRRVGKGELRGMIDEIESSSIAEELLDTKKLKAVAEGWNRIDFDDPAQDLAMTTYFSLALAGGLFIVEAERCFPSLS